MFQRFKKISFSKKILSLAVVAFLGLIAFLALSLFILRGYKFRTLTDWSQACFQKLPEYSKMFLSDAKPKIPVGPSPLKTPFSNTNPTELLHVMDKFEQKIKTSNLSDKSKWLDGAQPYFFDFADLKYSFVKKMQVPPGSQICFVGDLHGSIHSLLRILWRLIATGYLDEHFKIQSDKFFMIFLGDYTDRGRYSTEVLYTLMRLKLANWDSIELLRGNHELGWANEFRGFSAEVKGMTRLLKNKTVTFKGKFEDAFYHHGIDVYKRFMDLYTFMPGAVFISSGDDVVQCCHGGIEPMFNPQDLLSSMGKRYQKVGPFLPFKVGFTFDHFGAGNKGERRQVETQYRVDVAYAQNYFKKHGLKAIFRAHQHDNFGLKMIPKTGKLEDKLLHWTDVVSAEDKSTANGFLIKNYVPIFTFSAATEGIGVPYDCYGIVTTAKSFDQWKLKPIEIYLEDSKKRNGKYVSIKKSLHPDDDSIDVTWSKKPKKISVDKSVIR